MADPVAASPACPGCQARDATIARLEQTLARLQRQLAEQQGQIDALRRQLDQAQRAAKRQAAPFRRHTHRPDPKRPGRPQGHARAARPLPEKVDRVVDVPCDLCPRCQVPLADKVVHAQYQTDLPPVAPIVTRFDVHGGTCPRCRHYHQGRHPEMTSDAVGACANQVGPVALTMAAELKHRLGVPYRKVADFFATYFVLRVSPGTLVRAEQRLARKARPTFQLLVEALRRCGVVHADETGWRIGKVSAWLWVFSSASVTIYAIRTSRGHEVAEEVLGEDFDGVLVVDGWAAYDVLTCQKGRCNAHILRRCRDLLEQQPRPTDARHLERLLAILRAGLALWQGREGLAEGDYWRQVRQLETDLDSWILDETGRAGDAVQKLRRHLWEHREEFQHFLFQPAVPPTNNHAERMLRPAVISRKVGGCNKTLLGACVHGVLASLMVTLHQRGRRFLELALRLWRSPEAEAVALEGLPEVGAVSGVPPGPPCPTCGVRAVAFAASG